MKNIFKSALALAVAAPMLLTSCLEETIPTSVVTNEGLKSSSKATEALLWEMGAIFNKYNTLGQDNAYDWGYGSLMHCHDVMTEDMAIVSSNYDWYTAWEQAQYLSENYMNNQFQWTLYWKIVQTPNNVLSAVGTESDDALMASYIGVASAYRAAIYLDLAQTFEFLPNEKTSPIVTVANGDGTSSKNDVTGLTVPIVTENTTEELSKNNPRATHEEMLKFILEDLDRAEANIAKGARLGNTLPDLAVVYGLKARAYMWDGGVNPSSYQQAAIYARKAIDQNGATPATQAQWLSVTDAFNKYLPSWMWCISTTKDDRVVTSGVLNWTSWMSNETTFGYAVAGPYSMISKSLYDRISDTDFRKLAWKAPQSSILSGKEQTPLAAAAYKKLPDYASLKFKPSEGNTGESAIACSGDYPLMRVEEMYLIEAEAVAHSNPTEGMRLLSEFMQYRDPSYNAQTALASHKNDKDVLAGRITAEIAEIIQQKRVELWGEGLTFFDIKRLNMSVTRSYSNSNFSRETRFNTNGRPAWMNWCMLITEGNTNKAVEGWNNPSFDNVYTAQ